MVIESQLLSWKLRELMVVLIIFIENILTQHKFTKYKTDRWTDRHTLKGKTDYLAGYGNKTVHKYPT